MDTTNKRWGMYRLLPLLFSAMLMLLLPACVEEQITPPDKGKTITFSLNVPKGFTPSTYALIGTADQDIKTVDVLIFDSSDKLFSGPHYGIVSGADVTVRIPELSGNYDMVVLANCRSAINNAAFSVGDDKESVLADITVTNTDKWNTDTSDDSYAIPMWGGVENVNGSTNSVTVNLVRMLSRINVENKTSNFKLTKVYVYNYNKTGRVAPEDGKVTITGTTPNISVSVSEPSLPSGSIMETGPLEYTVPTEGGGEDYKYENEIYVFEANKGTAATHADNPCLVIGGRYGSDTSDTFYRIDFVESDGDYLDLLRNYSYNVTINQIGGSGQTDKETAFSSRSVNIEYNVVSWNDSQVGGIVTDGQYSLSVSAPTLNFDATARTTSSEDNILTITCNYGDEVTISSISSTGDWLSVLNSDGTVLADGNTISLQNEQAAIRLVFGDNSGGTTRTGSFVLTVGRMSYTVNVEQSNEKAITSFIGVAGLSDSYLLDGSTYEFYVVSDSPFTISGLPADVGSLSYDGSVAAPDGTKVSFTTNFITTGTNRDISLAITSGSNTKDVEFVGKPFLPVPMTITGLSDYYQLNGSTQTISFTAQSTVAWTITSVSQIFPHGGNQGALATGLEGSLLNKTGTAGTDVNLSFSKSNTAAANNGGFVKVVFSADGYLDYTLFIPVSGTKSGVSASSVIWAASNIYYDEHAGHLTFADVDESADPASTITDVERYQGVYFKWGSLYGISPAGDWGASTKVYPPWGGETTAGTLWGASPSWSSIPLVTTNLTNASSVNSLYYRTDDASTVDAQKIAARGDICRWLTLMGYAPGSSDGTKQWRMPTQDEFGITTSLSDDTNRDDFSVPALDGGTIESTPDGTNWVSDTSKSTDAGTYHVPMNSDGTQYQGRWNTQVTSKPYFPAAGSRGVTGFLANVGLYGYYWSTSPIGGTVRYLVFGSGFAYLHYNDRANGYNVRCVQDI